MESWEIEIEVLIGFSKI